MIETNKDKGSGGMRISQRWIAAALAAGLLAAGTAWAQNAAPASSAPPASREAVHQSFAPIVKKAAPAVVNVYSRRVVRTQSPLLNDPLLRQLFGRELQRLGIPRDR